jgi:hypothetical protein
MAKVKNTTAKSMADLTKRPSFGAGRLAVLSRRPSGGFRRQFTHQNILHREPRTPPPESVFVRFDQKKDLEKREQTPCPLLASPAVNRSYRHPFPLPFLFTSIPPPFPSPIKMNANYEEKEPNTSLYL